ELTAIQQTLLELDRQETDTANRVEQRHADYIQAGGERVEAARDKLEQLRRQLGDVSTAAGQYQKAATQVGLEATLAEAVFNANKQRIAAALASGEAETERAQNGFADAAIKQSRETERLRTLQQDIRAIESNPDSNIDPPFQNLRR